MLEGKHVRLEPMRADHLDAISAAGSDPALWRFTINDASSRDAMERYVADALQVRAAGTGMPFATIERARGTVVGSTRFANFDVTHRRVEIGWTWIAPAWQRTPINTEAKYLMLSHAFETVGVMRLELKTDATNEKSRRAIERIGATFEGIFRKHMLCDTGRVRDSAYYSIVDTEWPAVKARLEKLLA